MERQVINPWKWQDQFGFVQANEIRAPERTLISSGQTSVDDDGRPLHPGDMAAQMNKALDNLETVLQSASMGLADVVKLQYYTTDVDAWIQSAPAWMSRLAEAGCRPTSTLLGVARLAFPELLVEVEATAVA